MSGPKRTEPSWSLLRDRERYEPACKATDPHYLRRKFADLLLMHRLLAERGGDPMRRAK